MQIILATDFRLSGGQRFNWNSTTRRQQLLVSPKEQIKIYCRNAGETGRFVKWKIFLGKEKCCNSIRSVFFLKLISFIAASQVPEMIFVFFLLKKFMTFEGKEKHKKKFKIHEKRRPLLFCGKFKFFVFKLETGPTSPTGGTLSGPKSPRWDLWLSNASRVHFYCTYRTHTDIIVMFTSISLGPACVCR